MMFIDVTRHFSKNLCLLERLWGFYSLVSSFMFFFCTIASNKTIFRFVHDGEIANTQQIESIWDSIYNFFENYIYTTLPSNGYILKVNKNCQINEYH